MGFDLFKFFRNGLKRSSNSESDLKSYIDSRLKHQLLRLPIYIQDKIYTHTSEGLRIALDSRDLNMSLHILENGSWEDHVKESLQKHLKSDSIFVDVGANIGITSLYAARNITSPEGKIYCFEPAPKTFELLHYNVELNGMLDKIVIENKAVSDSSGIINFEYFSSHAGMSGIKVMDERLSKFKGKKESLEVLSTTLDEYFLENTKIDLIKIDVEGFEMPVIKGSKKIIKNNPKIKLIIEYYPEGVRSVLGQKSVDEFLDYLESERFKIFIIDHHAGEVEISYQKLKESSNSKSFGADLLLYK